MDNKQATVEDYNSSDSESDVVNPNFRRSPAAQGQANVAAKRSHPSDLGTDKPGKSPVAEKVGINIDLQSDSGYSSHTAATMSSADSAPSAKSQSPPSVAASAAPIPPPSPAARRRPPMDERKSSSSPRKPLQRTSSVSSKTRPSRERRSTIPEQCTDPNCNSCEPNVRGRRPKPSPLDSGLDISYPPFDQRSQRSDPAPAPSYVSPQSPTYSRQPDYMRGSAVVQPAQSMPRRSSSTARARPVSYHGGDPAQGYWVPGMPAPYPSPPQDYGPPPSMSAYHGMHYGMTGATPPNNFYPPGHPMQTSPPYDMRPQMPSRTPSSNTFNTRRPTSQYGPPLLTQEANAGNRPSARYPSSTPHSATQVRFPQSQLESESSEYGSSDEEVDNDRALMPPPKLTSSSKRRPSLRQRNTTQVYQSDRRMSQSLTLEPPRDLERDPRASRVSTTAASSRAPSKARPALIQQPKAQSEYYTGRSGQVMIEDPRSRRRSYQSYEVDQPRRRSRMYQEQDLVAPPRQPRRQTDSDARRRDEAISHAKMRDTTNNVEEYLQRTRGSDAPFNDSVHRAAKRASRVPSGPSDAGSSRSKGSDKASRVSHSNRTTVTNGGSGGEIRLRVDASAPVNLQFNGDMEGRTLQINPVEGGMADIVIGNSRGDENTYRSERKSERGSVLGSSRKTIVSERARREAEEMSTRSSRSSQGRRERERDTERRPLRRKGEMHYNA